MAWNLSTAKEYLEIPPADTSKDQQIQLALDTTQQSIESVLQRGLFFVRQLVRFQNVTTSRLYLPQFPIDTVHEITDGNNRVVEDWTVHHRTGWIEFLGVLPSPVSIDYDGGYQVLPLDLERAMWEAFMSLWGRTHPDTGGPLADGSSTPTAGAGGIRSLTVFDGFKVDYNAGAFLNEQDLLATDQHQWGWLTPWAATLALYRSEHGVGLGIA